MLNNTFFPANSGVYPLGANCHQQRQAQIPVWVVTDLAGNILLANAPQAGNAQQNQWMVTGGRITVNRFFQASTAMIVLSCSNTNFDVAYPTLPTKVARAVTNKSSPEPQLIYDLSYPLDKNDEICIWCGYIDQLRPVVTKDLQEHRLLRTFIGAIDTISVVGSTTQGVTMIIQCRDRMKYLMDSVGTFNTSDFNPLAGGSANKADVNATDSNDATLKDKITRSDIILEIARRCLGHLQGSPAIANLAVECDSVCGMRINPGYVAEYTQVNDTDGTGYQAMYDISNSENSYAGHKYSKGNPIPFIGGRTTTPTIPVPSIDPTFNIVTGRLPYKRDSLDAKSLASNQNITDRVPAEFIKFLSMQEPWPTEFFCDARSGEYWYAPRGLDISGLADPKRFFRTYFFRNAPAGALNEIKASATKMVGDIVSSIINPPANESTTPAPDAASTDDVIVEWKGRNYKVNRAKVLDQLTFNLFTDLNPFKKPLTAEEKTVVDIIKQLKDADSSNSSTLAQWAETFFQQNIVDADTAQVLDQQAKALKTESLVSLNSSISLVPDLGTIHTAQAALLFREESSTINWRSNIIVTSRLNTDEAGKQRAVHLKLIPSWLKGRNFACSYFTAEDETLGNNQAELVTVALAFARLYSKELKAATIHILGDPSMVPGECVQVFGSPLHPDSMMPRSGENPNNWLWDREAITVYVNAYQELYKNRIQAHKTQSDLNETATDGSDTATASAAAGTDPKLAAVSTEVPFIGSKVQTITDLTKYAQAQLMCPAYFDEAVDPSSSDASNRVIGGGTGSTGASVSYESMATTALETELVAKYKEFMTLVGKPEEANKDIATSQLVAEGLAGIYYNPILNDEPKKVLVDSKNKEFNDIRAELKKRIGGEPGATTVGLNEINFPEDPKTMWRVEAVIHKFNEQPGSGFRTELALLSPF